MRDLLLRFNAFWRTHARVCIFAGLGIVIVAAYWPSLYHVARGDQINYFAEMASRHGFVDTVPGSFDLNRTRSFGPGDELAFRPLLYILLGFEKYWFGYDFFWWQVFGLGAHLFAVGALYAFLCRVRTAFFAFIACALFAFLPVNIEAVAWHHISAYLVFAGCVLMALRNFYAALIDEQLGLRHETTALAWMVPAVFLYEAGVWYVMVMGAYLWFRGKGYHSAAWGAWAIAAVALGVNALDLLVRGVNVAGAPDLLKEGHVITTTLGNALLLVKWFLSASFFLGQADLIPVSRMMVRPDVVSWTWPLGQPLSWALAGGAVLVSACLAGAFYCRLFHRGSRRSMAFLAMCLAMLAGYLVIIALGRINGLGAQGIRTCLYYPYNFLILLIAAVALALPFDAGAAGARGKVLKWAAVACFSMVILFNVWTVRRVAGDIARDHRVVRQFVIELDHFVQAHKKEQGFSFYVGPQYPGNYTPDWVSRRGDAPGRMYTLAEALYPQYYSKNRPRYVIQPGL